jgi:rubrerythrin
MKLKGTKTEKNLLAAFAGESQARNRYTFFASASKKEGYEQIASIFLETAENEKEHAKRYFSFLEGGIVEFTAAFPAGIIGTTAQNLKSAAAGEHEEWTALYPGFGKIAEEEGFLAVAAAFRYIAKVEVEHEKRYLKLLENVEKGTAFKKDSLTTWICRNCGYHHEGFEPPGQCPTCLHPKSFFELWGENY